MYHHEFLHKFKKKIFLLWNSEENIAVLPQVASLDGDKHIASCKRRVWEGRNELEEEGNLDSHVLGAQEGL